MTATCEDCGDGYDPDDGCQHVGHNFCPSCLTNCGECGDAIREQYALEGVADGRWS